MKKNIRAEVIGHRGRMTLIQMSDGSTGSLPLEGAPRGSQINLIIEKVE